MTATITKHDTSDALDTAGRLLLAKVAEAAAEIAARPVPAATWQAAELADLRRFGPAFDASGWFNGGDPLPERERIRFLRAVRRLAHAGLMTFTRINGRLRHVKLTAAGEREAAALAGNAIMNTNITPEPAELARLADDGCPHAAGE
jgi:hypothetical protein